MNVFIYNFFTAKSETHYLTESATVRQALEKFDYHKFSVVPLVIENGTYLTTVSEGDILRYIKNHAHFDIRQAENVRISEIEKYRPYKACKHSVPIEEVFRLALDQNFVPIVDDRNTFIGIVKRKSILNLLYASQDKINPERIEEIAYD